MVAPNRYSVHLVRGSSIVCGHDGRRAAALLANSLGYLAVLGSSLAGYSGLGPWVIAVGAIALASVSRAQYSELYERSRDMGLARVVNSTTLRSLGNALVASSAAYVGGWALRLM
jgi:hypothetical protein